MAQWNKTTQDFLNQERTLFEVFNVATSDGEQVTVDNPFPVSLGSSTITIVGDITIPATISVASSEANPVHNHITEVGTSDILTTPYLPVGIGTNNLNLTYLPVGISSLLNTVSIANTVSISNTSFYITNPVTSVTVGGTVSIANTVSISNTSFYVLNPVTSVTVGGTVSIGNTVSISNTSFYITNPVTEVSVTGIGSTVSISGTVNIGNEVSINDGGNSITVDGTVSVSAGASIAITGQNLDAFGRLRVSEPYTLADYSHVYGEELELLTKTVGAASTTTASGTEAAIILSVGTGATDQVIHQSRMYHHYMPGKSQYILESFNFREPRNNTYKAIGYFDDYNGVFAKQVGIGTTARYDIVKRSNVGGAVAETAIPQSEWNIDSLDGTGPSGINIFFERSQLLFIDYQWLGVGRIRVGFENGGTFHTAHEFTHTGDIEYVYWSLPSLPVRCEVGNFGAAVGIASLAQMCATVMSEGGYVETGVEFSADSGATLVEGSNNAPDDYKCVMAIRLKNSYRGLQNRSIVRVSDLELLSTSAPCKFELWRVDDSNASITGGSWVSANNDSVVEYNTTPTSISFTGADKRASGFFAANNPSGKQASGTISIDPTTAKRSYLSQNIDSDNSNAYVVMVRNLTTNVDTNVYAAIQWRETR